MNPERVKELVNKGNEFFHQGRFDEAIKCYDEALALRPNYSAALFNKANALCELGKLKEAIAFFDRALEADPEDWEALHNKGNALFNLCCFKEALECYDKALELNPHDADTIYNKGNLLFRLGRFEEAAKLYDEALALNPQLVGASINKALALLIFSPPGGCEEAIARVESVLDTWESVWNPEKLPSEDVQKFKEDVPYLMIQIMQNLAETCGLEASKTVRRIKDLLVKILGEKQLRVFVKKLRLDLHPEAATYRDILNQG
ncbi:MAG: tetratricopeptide repeat protein [Candidatus Freyarchaeota archaeon]